MRRLTIIVLAGIILTGCATTAKYEAKVRTWEGRDPKVLLQAWGQPDAIEPLSNGNKVFLYTRLKRMPVSYQGAQRHLASAPTPVVAAYPAGIYIKCATYFEVTPKNRIEHVMFRGEECKARDEN